MDAEFDLFIIGGGINGCGIARDSAGRGLRVGLAEMNDFGAATSSASTKLFHGGLRYLEYLEIRLVREALVERDILLRAMPHIAWPMRFVLPHHPSMRFDSDTPVSRILGFVMPWMKGRRPAWLIRLGLFMYDKLGGRSILPGTTSLNLHRVPEGKGLKAKFERAFEYSDCWIEDSRLVVLNARDAEARGATLFARWQVVQARVDGALWRLTLQKQPTGETKEVSARMVVNAAGPWVGEVLRGTLQSNIPDTVRLVRGSHIVTKRLFDHDKCYFFQGEDGRIIFAIPYETDFTLIGTTDQDHGAPDERPECTPEEEAYLLDFINTFLAEPIASEDIVWRYSGVRPLYDDGASSASAATRDYVLRLDTSRGAPSLNIFGGKITTYRKLAESALEEIEEVLGKAGPRWTAESPLPGGDFPVDAVPVLIAELCQSYPFLTKPWAKRLVRAYGTEAREILGDATSPAALGEHFGATLTEAELRWLIDREYARTTDDVIWRRSKLGLRLSAAQTERLDSWIEANAGFDT